MMKEPFNEVQMIISTLILSNLNWIIYKPNRCRLAQELMYQYVCKTKVDVVLHDFKTRKTRRNRKNFRYTSKDADLNKVILKFQFAVECRSVQTCL